MSDELREALAEALECVDAFVDVFGNEWRDGTPLKDRYNAWKAALAAPAVSPNRETSIKESFRYDEMRDCFWRDGIQYLPVTHQIRVSQGRS